MSGLKNKWGVDHFDLETAMMNVAMTQDDILLVAEMAYEKNWSADKTMNAWIGLAHLLEARTLKQEEIFIKLHELNDYAPQHQKDLRPKHWEEKDFDCELTYAEHTSAKLSEN